jgi:hypothetical protein
MMRRKSAGCKLINDKVIFTIKGIAIRMFGLLG